MSFALSVQISALSWILSTKYHLEIHDIGLVWAMGPIAGIFGQVIIGKVRFWNGRRRPFIIIGGLLASLMLRALPNIDVITAALGMKAILGMAIVIVLSLDIAINVGFNRTRALLPMSRHKEMTAPWIARDSLLNYCKLSPDSRN